jgi:hypothetical protein
MVGWWLDPAPHKVSAHTSHLVYQVLNKHGTARLQQPTYSSDLAPCYFFLFPTLKNVVKEHRFQAMEDIERNSLKTLLDIPKEEEMLGEVCSCGRELCWSQLGLNPLKLFLLQVLWSISVLFEQTMYVYRIYRKYVNYRSICPTVIYTVGWKCQSHNPGNTLF